MTKIAIISLKMFGLKWKLDRRSVSLISLRFVFESVIYTTLPSLRMMKISNFRPRYGSIKVFWSVKFTRALISFQQKKIWTCRFLQNVPWTYETATLGFAFSSDVDNDVINDVIVTSLGVFWLKTLFLTSKIAIKWRKVFGLQRKLDEISVSSRSLRLVLQTVICPTLASSGMMKISIFRPKMGH